MIIDQRNEEWIARRQKTIVPASNIENLIQSNK